MNALQAIREICRLKRKRESFSEFEKFSLFFNPFKKNIEPRYKRSLNLMLFLNFYIYVTLTLLTLYFSFLLPFYF